MVFPPWTRLGASASAVLGSPSRFVAVVVLMRTGVLLFLQYLDSSLRDLASVAVGSLTVGEQQILVGTMATVSLGQFLFWLFGSNDFRSVVQSTVTHFLVGMFTCFIAPRFLLVTL